MTQTGPIYTALTYLAGLVFPLVGASSGLVALWSLGGFVRGIFADLRGNG